MAQLRQKLRCVWCVRDARNFRTLTEFYKIILSRYLRSHIKSTKWHMQPCRYFHNGGSTFNHRGRISVRILGRIRAQERGHEVLRWRDSDTPTQTLTHPSPKFSCSRILPHKCVEYSFVFHTKMLDNVKLYHESRTKRH